MFQGGRESALDFFLSNPAHLSGLFLLPWLIAWRSPSQWCGLQVGLWDPAVPRTFSCLQNLVYNVSIDWTDLSASFLLEKPPTLPQGSASVSLLGSFLAYCQHSLSFTPSCEIAAFLMRVPWPSVNHLVLFRGSRWYRSHTLGNRLPITPATKAAKINPHSYRVTETLSRAQGRGLSDRGMNM